MICSELMLPLSPLLTTTMLQTSDWRLHLPQEADFIPVIDPQGRYLGCLDLSCPPFSTRAELQKNIASYLTPVPCFPATTPVPALEHSVLRAVVSDATGKICGIIRTLDLLEYYRRDISQFKDQFYSIINSTQNGIMAVDQEGTIILASRAAEEILQLSAQDYIGRNISDAIPNSLLPKVLATCEPLLGQKVTINNVVVLANYAPIRSGNQVVGAVSVFQDVSLLESIAAELANTKLLYKEVEAIVNSSYDGLFITDGNGVVLQLNKAYERITGITAQEVVGKTMQSLVAEKYFDQSVSLLVLQERKTITINQKTRGGRQVLATGNPVFDDLGELFRIVTNVRDITELVQLQDKLDKTQAQTIKYQTELSHLRSLQITDENLVYRSPAMRQAVELALKVADVDSNVLITGESGTGKEVIAKLIHKHGKGLAKPFIQINCAAIPEQLLESELFGYEGGAFTGAKKEGKPGLFELAHGGTLFLDEIGDLPLILQGKLLRAIQEKAVLRIGGTKPISIQVRIIAATHRNLKEMIKTRDFREDLFYRLMVIPITLPPLRERPEDIPLLIQHFINIFNSRFHYHKKASPLLIDALLQYSWPGNIRELENTIERLMVTTTHSELVAEDFIDTTTPKGFVRQRGAKLKTALEQAEALIISETYAEYPSWPKVAQILGVDRSTMFRKAAKHGLLR